MTSPPNHKPFRIIERHRLVIISDYSAEIVARCSRARPDSAHHLSAPELRTFSAWADEPRFDNLAEPRSLRTLWITDCGLRDLRPLSEFTKESVPNDQPFEIYG
jgi:hypothetical protein